MIAGIITWAISKITPKIAIALAICAGLALVYYMGARSSGDRAERQAMESVVRQTRERAGAEADVDRESDPAERLRRDWQRR